MRLKSLLLGACLAQSALVSAVLLGTTPSAACSPPAPFKSYYTLEEGSPVAEPERLARDGVVWIHSRAWKVPATREDIPDSFDQRLSVTVRDVETNEAIPGKLLFSGWRDLSSTAWVPDVLLRPQRRYELVATLNQDTPRPDSAQGPTEIHRSLLTDAEAAPPLALQGELGLALERVDRQRALCSTGECVCDRTTTETVSQARVRIPGIEGGTGDYRIEFHVSEDVPVTLDSKSPDGDGHLLAWKVFNTTGAPLEATFEMPYARGREDFDYAPCISWRVTDAAGHSLEGTPMCLDSAEPKGGLGCAMTPEGAFAGPVLLLGAAATLWRGRRRQSARP